jgi:hypothetical protein
MFIIDNENIFASPNRNVASNAESPSVGIRMPLTYQSTEPVFADDGSNSGGILNRPKWQVALLVMGGGIISIILLIVAIYCIILLTEFMVSHYIITLSIFGVGIIGFGIYKYWKYWSEHEGYNEI